MASFTAVKPLPALKRNIMPQSATALTRRTLVTTAPIALAAASCTSARGTEPDEASPTTLRVGVADATGIDGVDPLQASAGASQIVVRHLYDSLMVLEGGEYRYELAEAVEPNEDGSVWTITIRADAAFHDGTPVTATDVAYSITTLAGPDSNRASVYAGIEPDAVQAVDHRTVTVAFPGPRADFRESVLVVYSPVFPDQTTDFTDPVGSGPYRYEASDQQTVRLTAVDGHWRGTGPATLEIRRISDPTARLNALVSAEIDYAVGLGAAGARTIEDDHALEVVPGDLSTAFALAFSMNQRLAPFDDARVRQAVRLAADREAMLEAAVHGFGETADDVVGKGLPGYADLAPRTTDAEAASDLFAEAGVTELTLITAEVVPGMSAAAQVLKQNLEAAGVELTLDEAPADTYYADLEALATRPFQAFYYSNRPAAVHLAATTHAVAPFNVTGAGEDHWSALAAAQALVDDGARADAFAAMQTEFYETGGDLLWAFSYQLDGARAGVKGVFTSQGVPVFTAVA
jgi:peptide/nickel transport system substrate-binding protein